MSKVENVKNESLQRVFIEATCATTGHRRDLDLDCIKRFDDIKGKMRLLFNDGEERNFYFVPDLTYDEAREKIRKLQSLNFVNLANL